MKTLLALILALPAASAAPLEFRGTARSLEDGQVLYTELHTVTIDERGFNKKVETRYYDPSGKPIAQLRSDFTRHPFVPDAEFEDYRFQRKESMFTTPDGKRILMRVEESGKLVAEEKHDLRGGMAAGQGFDNFIKSRFTEITPQGVPLRFGVMAKADFFAFKAFRADATPERVRFGIKLDSLFLRLFADELKVEYAPESRRLLSYRGLSNLRSAKGGDQQVHIAYEYSHAQRIDIDRKN